VPYLGAQVGARMLNSYPQELSTGTNSCGNTPNSTLKVAAYLTRRVASQLAGEPLRRIARRRSLVLLAVLCVIGITPAKAYDPNIESYKLYAHMKLLDDKQYRCLVILWRMESQWSPTAKNKKSSAYGIPQLLKMKETNPYKQIDLGLKYIAKRYGNPCKALDHHKKVGHY
jgi:hypothetical protein